MDEQIICALLISIFGIVVTVLLAVVPAVFYRLKRKRLERLIKEGKAERVYKSEWEHADAFSRDY